LNPKSMLSEETIRSIINYARKVRTVVRSLRDGVKLLNSMRMGEAIRILANGIKADTEADNMRRDIIFRIGTEVRVGYVREWVARLIRRLDLVSESAKEASRYLTIIPYLEIPNEVRDVIEELSRLAMDSIDLVIDGLEALMEGDKTRAIRYADKVEEVEELTDNIIVNGRKLLVMYGQKINNPAIIIMVKDFMEALENITDYAEDAADYIRTIALRMEE